MSSGLDPTPAPGPATQSVYPSRFLDPERARLAHGELVDELGAALRRGDPLADDLAAAIGRDRALFSALEQALREGIDRVVGPPPELTALMAEVDRVPDWVDWGRIRRGGEVFLRTGALGGFVLGAAR